MKLTPLDGNAVAGDLQQVFAVDVTVAVTTCASCHHRHVLATLRAYLQAPGVVLRCPSCDAVQLRLVRGPDRIWLEVRGIDLLEMPVSGPG